MLKRLRKFKGQSTLEYAVLIIIIIGALLSIQVYIKRGIQGRLRSAADDIGDQFSPGNTNFLRTTSTVGASLQTFNRGVSKTIQQGRETTNVVMNQYIINVEQEYWGK